MTVDRAGDGATERAAADPAAQTHRIVMRWRREQRATLSAARLAMPSAVHREASRLIRQHLSAYLQRHRPAVLGGYWPIRREFNPLSVMRAQLKQGARLALPVIAIKNQPLEFHLWSPGAPMAKGVYDIAYPVDSARVLPDMMLVPLLGFDAAGYRLGYGGGYYDRTAAALEPRPQLVGIAFESARLPSIRPLPHDIPMACIITEQGTRSFDR